VHRCALLLAALLPLCATAGGDDELVPHVCPDARLAVADAEPADAEMVCEGGSRALGFLADLGLRLPGTLLVQVVSSLPTLYGVGQLGSFDATAGLIQVLAYDDCAALDQEDLLFDQPLSADLYRSVVAHEVAHAVVEANYSGDRPRLVPQEYIAYTTQFVVMSPGLRERILGVSPISAFAGEHQMSAMRYFIDPQAFGIAAYRHFLDLPEGRPFVWRLLRGEARLPPMSE
jgi:hypothetical protein